jgi:hypothetical protein
MNSTPAVSSARRTDRSFANVMLVCPAGFSGLFSQAIPAFHVGAGLEQGGELLLAILAAAA